ncbi:aspartate aminotransferase family protein [Panacibacter ginsenosidivorans]|uniref:Aspartate aminotransferase family protein n=1 Tax=Panacibacter ginsenosidivorans TaxID=1813871 RepID=A0A5B8V6E9_9BACT|nr:pyridoxal-dependent decarboxylase [Panacibacter ginsenosidivorans]QEC66216.1 aspartate aminotransferase family protein [Panacibacter ginsenosidivorans]
MNAILQNDLNNISAILESVKDLSNTYLENIQGRATSKSNAEFKLSALPQTGLGYVATQQLFEEGFLDNIVASSGPRYWGFVTGGTTPAAIAGDWLAAVFDQNTQSEKGNGDVSAKLELHTIKLLLQLFELPEVFMGAFVTGATMSNFTGLAVARQWYGKQKGYDVAIEGIKSSIKIYTAVPHSSAIKSLAMLGIGSSNVIMIPTLPERECMDTKAFEYMISEHPQEPFILIASGGTVNTVDFDDMQFIASLKRKYHFWWHIDAAFGGFAACAPAYKNLLKGWELADSITVDNHKWLNVPYDSAVIFTRKEHAMLQVQTFQNSNAPYLGDPLQNFTYLNYVPENSRRFRALPAWFTLMAYGKDGHRQIVEHNISLAQQLGEALENSSYFKLAAPVRLNTVCFTIKDTNNAKEKIATLLNELNKRGKVFMTPTVYKSQFCIRAAFVNYRTTTEDVQIAITELKEVYELTK